MELTRRHFLSLGAASAGLALAPSRAIPDPYDDHITESRVSLYNSYRPQRLAEELGSDIFTRPASHVGVRLKCLVDVSGSISENENIQEYSMQKNGIASALRSDEVKSAIRSQGGIAFSLTEFHSQPLSRIPWALLQSDEDVEIMSSLVYRMPIFYDRKGTGIARGLSRSLTDFQNCIHSGARSVLDVSGDGADNESAHSYIDGNEEVIIPEYTAVNNAAQRLWQAGITCNAIALPADNNSNLPPGINTVEDYYRRFVITPQNTSYADEFGFASPLRAGFTMAVNRWEDFQAAMTEKLRLEIIGQLPTLRRSYG
jgi:hypothetical protein